MAATGGRTTATIRHRTINTVTIQGKESPITRGLPPTFPEVNDEVYANLKWQPAGTFHVLATAWDDHSLYRPGEKQPIPGAGANEPMLWIVNYGSGRVFATALGHDVAAMKNQGFITTLARGTEWAATRKWRYSNNHGSSTLQTREVKSSRSPANRLKGKDQARKRMKLQKRANNPHFAGLISPCLKAGRRSAMALSPLSHFLA